MATAVDNSTDLTRGLLSSGNADDAFSETVHQDYNSSTDEIFSEDYAADLLPEDVSPDDVQVNSAAGQFATSGNAIGSNRSGLRSGIHDLPSLLRFKRLLSIQTPASLWAFSYGVATRVFTKRTTRLIR